jgi:tellurite resistance protein TerA
MDLHSLALPKKEGSPPPEKKKGFLKNLIKNVMGDSPESYQDEVHIYFGMQGNLERHPFIKLDKDSGVGGSVDGADRTSNEENIHFKDLTKYDLIAILVNNFGGQSFKEANCKLIVTCGTQNLEIPVVETSRGSWLLAAVIDNRDNTPMLVNINKVSRNRPTITEAIQSLG